VYATVLDISWDDAGADKAPHRVSARFVKCDEWDADLELQQENDRAYAALLPLRNTELARVPPSFEPLSSKNSRGQICTMGRLICSLIRSALNVSRRQREMAVDAVLIMGGNIRGGVDIIQILGTIYKNGFDIVQLLVITMYRLVGVDALLNRRHGEKPTISIIRK
jgi:hypothetical protein